MQCHSWLQRQRVALSIIDFYYVAVRIAQRGTATTDYLLDLRFIDPSFTLMRRVPWRWIWAALALTAAAACAIAWWSVSKVATPARDLATVAAAALTAGAALAYVRVAAKFVESVVLYSVHGRAPVLEYRGGLGTFRRLRPFLRRLAAHVQLAAAARRATKAEHLRDELREHHRLREDGVLPAETYDASKARILAQHDPKAARRAAGARA